jgi:hypothetical protein
MSKYRTGYTVTVEHADDTNTNYDNLSLSEAKKTAKQEAAADADARVYIEKFRQADGQRMYYNRDGFNCVGKPW